MLLAGTGASKMFLGLGSAIADGATWLALAIDPSLTGAANE